MFEELPTFVDIYRRVLVVAAIEAAIASLRNGAPQAA